MSGLIVRRRRTAADNGRGSDNRLRQRGKRQEHLQRNGTDRKQRDETASG